jgi:hypothetical protein
MEKKFTALRIIAVIIKVLAWIVAGLTVLGFLGSIIMGATMGTMMGRYSPSPYGNIPGMGALGGVFMAFFVLIYGAFMFVGLLAWSDLIMVVLAVEENTRAMRPPTAPA